MQATHNPLCEARDGTPTGLDDETVRERIGTSLDKGLRLVDDNDAEIERIRIKLDTALESTGYGWETSLGDLVGGELTDMLKDGRADDDIEWMRAAETKFDQYCRCL